jgi:hypothetical protein
MGRLEPAALPHCACIPTFLIGRNSRGQWVVRDPGGCRGGLYVDRVEALKFALFENGRHPQAVVMVPGLLELEFDVPAAPPLAADPHRRVA